MISPLYSFIKVPSVSNLVSILLQITAYIDGNQTYLVTDGEATLGTGVQIVVIAGAPGTARYGPFETSYYVREGQSY